MSLVPATVAQLLVVHLLHIYKEVDNEMYGDLNEESLRLGRFQPHAASSALWPQQWQQSH